MKKLTILTISFSFLTAIAAAAQTPATPNATFTLVYGCGSTYVTRSNNVPANTVWYWQTTATGTSTTYSGTSYNGTTVGLFLRPRRTVSPLNWGTAQQVPDYVVYTNTMTAPASSTGASRFGSGSVTLTVAAVAGATNYVWYSTSGSQEMITTTNSWTISNLTATATYNVATRNAGGCESSARTAVTGTVTPLPVIIVGDQKSVSPGSPVSLSTTLPFTSYSWRNALNQEVSTSATFSTDIAGTYSVTVMKTGVSGSGSATVNVTCELINQNINYISTTSFLVAGITTVPTCPLPSSQRNQTVQYFDGLGRSIQTVTRQASPTGHDVVMPVVYDAFGQESKKYLPFVASTDDGWYKSGVIAANGAYAGTAANTYQNNPNGAIAQDTRPYGTIVFENSTLHRPVKAYGSGNDWSESQANKFTGYQYLLNQHATGLSSNGEKIIAWQPVAGTPVREIRKSAYVETGGYYASGMLRIRQITDENGAVTREYTDRSGKVVLKKTLAIAGTTDLNSTTGWALTYYIYDARENLVTVLQPMLSKKIHEEVDTYVVTATDLANWAFQYKYDALNRMSEKQVPGAGAVYMVYDKRDRLVLTQDANQRSGSNKYWTFTKYDALNRPVLTGIKDTSVLLTQVQMQSAVNAHYAKAWAKYGETYVGNAANNVHGYSNKSYPVLTGPATTNDVNRYLTVTYYDTYDFKSLWTGSYNYVDENLSQTVNGITYNQPDTEFTRVTGQVTGTKTKVLDGGVAGGYTWLKSVNYYDDDYRVIQTLSDNYKGGTDRVTSLYDFTGKVLKTKSIHTQADLVWKDLVSATTIGNRLVSVGSPVGWGGSGAASVQQLGSGQDGWVESTASAVGYNWMLGLSDQNTDANVTSLDYAWYLGTSSLTIWESGVARSFSGTYLPGDVLRIERTGTTIKYYQNGILRYTSAVPSSTVLMVDVAMEANSNIVGVRSSFSTSSQITTRRFDYDHAGRLINTWHQLGSGPEILLVKNEYNELGQLIDKKLHSTQASGSDAKQSIDYRYNIRGWLTRLNESDLSIPQTGEARDLFGMQLGYNEDLGVSNTGLYNGNISVIKWSNNLSLGTVKENAYLYSYDPMNRLSASAFKEKSGTWTAATNNGNAETGFTYDLNGNIKTLQRNDQRANGWMDNLTYIYGSGSTLSNKLLKVADAGDDYKGFIDGSDADTEYTYDANGNMITDLNKGLSTAITYNFLNLPERITKGANTITYIYDATGRKLAQITDYNGAQKQTDYAGEYQYENDVLYHIAHEEGRIVMASTETVYTNGADATTGMTASNATLAAITANGTEQYVRATSNGTVARTGIYPIATGLTVTGGETYRIRAKGYRTGANTVHLLIKVNGADTGWPGATLANGATAESWTEQTVTIPAGATTLEAGVVWNTVTSGQQFFLNEFEIIKISTNPTPEYQYNLKDHLGNVRMTFTSKQQVNTYTATLETASEETEIAAFSPSYENATIINSNLYNKTTSGSKSQRLSAANADEIVGLAKSLSVMPGDTVHIKVYGKYYTPTNTNSNAAAAMLASMAQAFGVSGASTGEALKVYNRLDEMFGSGFLLTSEDWEDEEAPKAFLNYILFDKDFVPYDMGWDQIDAGALETGMNVTHDELMLLAPVTKPGYIYIYLSNENEKLVDVYFDDLTIEHKLSPVLQQDGYYPFGLNFNSYQRENSVANQYKISTKELQDELDLGWFDYGKRMYQPEIGKWTSPDPLAYEYFDYSPYTFVLNNPLKYVDPKGDSVELIIGKPYTDAAGEYHPYGHMALRVYNSAEGYDKVYDFGRYGAVRGLFGQTGDGILNVYNNSEAYLKEEQSIRESNGYSKPTTVEEDKKIMAHFDGLIADGSSYSKRDNKNRKSYKLDDYDIKDNNCCTVAGDGLNQINQNWMGNDEFDPRGALKTLEKDYKSLGLTKKVYYKGGVRITVYEAQKKPENKKRRMSRQEEPMID